MSFAFEFTLRHISKLYDDNITTKLSSIIGQFSARFFLTKLLSTKYASEVFTMRTEFPQEKNTRMPIGNELCICMWMKQNK